MPNTQRGFPYPVPSDPVAQGAANIQALAVRADLSNKSLKTYKNGLAQGSGAGLAMVNFAGTLWLDWAAGWGAGAPFVLVTAGAGRYRVTYSVTMSGQTGTADASGCTARGCLNYYAPGDILTDQAWASTAVINAGFTISQVFQVATGAYFTCLFANHATAAAGLANCYCTVEQLGPASVGSMLRPAEEDDPDLAAWLEELARRQAEYDGPQPK